MVNLCDRLQSETFVRKLGACEYAAASRGGVFDDYELEFIHDMRKKFDGRMDDTDFGLTPWNPTRKQWNMLFELYEKVRI